MNNKPPKRIFLQWYGDSSPDDYVDSVSEGGVTWAEDKVFKHDVEYWETNSGRRFNLIMLIGFIVTALINTILFYLCILQK